LTWCSFLHLRQRRRRRPGPRSRRGQPRPQPRVRHPSLDGVSLRKRAAVRGRLVPGPRAELRGPRPAAPPAQVAATEHRALAEATTGRPGRAARAADPRERERWTSRADRETAVSLERPPPIMVPRRATPSKVVVPVGCRPPALPAAAQGPRTDDLVDRRGAARQRRARRPTRSLRLCPWMYGFQGERSRLRPLEIPTRQLCGTCPEVTITPTSVRGGRLAVWASIVLIVFHGASPLRCCRRQCFQGAPSAFCRRRRGIIKSSSLSNTQARLPPRRLAR
jgi:hypothetical protein